MIVKLCKDVPEVGDPDDYYGEHGSRLSLVTVHGLTNRAAQQVVDRELDEVAEAIPLSPHLSAVEPARTRPPFGDPPEGGTAPDDTFRGGPIMGSASDMAATNRASAVLDEAPPDAGHPVPDLKALVGQTVTVKSVGIDSEHQAKLTASAVLVDASGKEHDVELGTVLEIRDAGVCGYALEEYLETDVLEQMLRDAIANEDNGLDSEDRESLQEDLDWLTEGGEDDE